MFGIHTCPQGQEIKVGSFGKERFFLLGIVEHRRHTKFMYLLSRISRLVDMSPLMKMQLSNTLEEVQV